MQQLIARWLLSQTAINIYSISFVWGTEYIYNKNYNIKGQEVLIQRRDRYKLK